MAKGKKKINTLLIVGVLGIWGFVIYRFVAGLNSDDAPITFSENTIPKNKTTSTVDTFSLLLNYDDPFLSHSFTNMEEKNNNGSSSPSTHISRKTDKKQKTKKNEPIAIVTPVIIPWPKVNYSGMIKNHSNNVTVGMFLVDNNTFLVKNGETVNGIKILNIYSDSIKVE